MGRSEQPKPSRMRQSTDPREMMGPLGTMHMAGEDREPLWEIQADPITELSHATWRWTNLLHAGGICPLFKTQLRKAVSKPYTCTVREEHTQVLRLLISGPPLTPDLTLDHAQTPKAGLSADPVAALLEEGRGDGAGDHPMVGRDKGTWSSSRARYGPPRSWLGHHTPSHNPWERHRVGWGAGALQPTAASLAGESSWVKGNRKIINRPEEGKKKKSPKH